ncbi:hypothetical protein B0H14DRAFT_3446872 [Mycena olivaceomarginata]|nr:hypothetical protein B0H14DRAFT_3446872 [Mycena olivaceomarginata]
MESLRLYDTRFRWEDIALFTRITTLVPQYRAPGQDLTMGQLAAVLRGSPVLARLSLCIRILPDRPSDAVGLITLPHLAELDMELHAPSVISGSLSRCQFLSLTSLLFDILSPNSPRLLLALLSHNPSVTSASFTGELDRRDVAVHILNNLPSLINLKLTCIRPPVSPIV